MCKYLSNFQLILKDKRNPCFLFFVFFFLVCNLRPVFEKALFDVAGVVLFRRIWNTVNRSKNAIFPRSALSNFPFELFYGKSYSIFHNPKCKMTLFENSSILESALQPKVSFSLAVLPCQI